MQRRLFSRRDIVIFLCLIALSALALFFMGKENGEVVEIWVDGELYKKEALSTPMKLTLENGVEIECDGEAVFFSHSDCPDKVCVRSGKMKTAGQWAACLPNKTVVKISGKEKVDTVG